MRIKGGQLVVELTGPFATLARVIAGLNGSKVSEKQLSDYRIFELAQKPLNKGQKGRLDPATTSLLRSLDMFGTVDWKALQQEMQWLVVAMPGLNLSQ